MKVIVGLGNPGDRYAHTRHNVGFDVIDELARRHGLPSGRIKFEAETWEMELAGEKLWLLKPMTYMNNSGRSVRQCLDFFRLNSTSLLVICDDLNLPLGQLRLRASGSDGGQKGLRDIRQQLNSDGYARLRIGIGRPPGQMDAADFVLSRFSKSDQDVIGPTIVQAADGVECWVRLGISKAMNRINAPELPAKTRAESPPSPSGSRAPKADGDVPNERTELQ